MLLDRHSYSNGTIRNGKNKNDLNKTKENIIITPEFHVHPSKPPPTVNIVSNVGREPPLGFHIKKTKKQTRVIMKEVFLVLVIEKYNLMKNLLK